MDLSITEGNWPGRQEDDHDAGKDSPQRRKPADQQWKRRTFKGHLVFS
ncbi:hypothetical protein [Arthrobacter sp. CC3]